MTARKRAPRKQAFTDELRFAAETYYTLQPVNVTLDTMAAMPRFAEVGVQRLRRWAEEGAWQQKRQAQLDKVRGLLQARMASGLVERRVEQLDAMQDMWDQGISMLANEDLTPRGGWEGVAGTVLRIGKQMDDWRCGVMQELAPKVDQAAAEAGALPTNMLPRLAEDEARAAARAIVELRRRKVVDAMPPAALPGPARAS